MDVRTITGGIALVCAPLLVLGPPALAAPGPSTSVVGPEVVADGLVGPLGLAVSDDGTVYVAEQFAGRLSAVATTGEVTTVAEGPVSGVDARGRGSVTVTLASPPEEGGEPMGAVARVSGGKLRTVGSPLQHEADTNPDGVHTFGFRDASPGCLADADLLGLGPHAGAVYSNPYAVLLDRADRVVADAGGNSIVRVGPDRRTSTVAAIPPVPVVLTEEQRQALLASFNEGAPPEQQLPPGFLSGCTGSTFLAEPVPTDVELGPGRDYYVSSLPGFPEAPGSGGVYRVDRRTGDVERLHGGFSGAVDLAVDDDGTVYVAELFAGQVTRVDASGARDSVEVPSPGAVEITDDGTLYVTSGVLGPSGQLQRWESWPEG